MTITRLTLVSHASTAALRTAAFPADEPLDAGGRADATTIASSGPMRVLLRGSDQRCAGPEQRAVETLALLSSAIEAAPPPVLDDAWRDWDLGRWRGRSWAEVTDAEPGALASWMTDAGAAPHDGESLVELLARAGSALDRAIAVNPASGAGFERIVVVTHPAVIRAATVVAIRATPESFWRIDVPPLSATTLQHHADRWTLRAPVRHEATG